MGMKALYKELARIQRELKAPKNQYNSFGRYKYRSCEDILEGLKLVLNGCTVTVSDEVVMVGSRVYVMATATISDGENSVSNKAYAREPDEKKGMDESQITGAASSYARKYALNGLFLIDDTKDADSMNNSAPTVSMQIDNCTTRKELERLWGSLSEHDKAKHKDAFTNKGGSLK